MSYLINNSNGDLILELFDGTADGPEVNPPNNATDINLIGRNYPSYGTIQNENFIKLLENFSKSTAPLKPIKGQLWYDSSVDRLKVYNGSTFKLTAGFAFTASTAAPTGNSIGDQWWDTTNSQLKSYNGASWDTVGPLYSQLDGLGGAIPEKIDSHPVVKIYANGNLVAIFSWDAQFVPSSPISGFPIIYPGLTLSQSNGGFLAGHANNSVFLGNVSSTNYARTDIQASFSANISVGTGNILIQNNPISNEASITSTYLDKDLSFYVNVSGTVTKAITIDGSTGEVRLNADPSTTLGTATKGYVDTAISTALTSYALLASPIFTGVPQSVTPSTNDSSNKIATTAFTKSAIAAATDSKWQGAAKYVRSTEPTTAEAASASIGDFWFQV